MPAPGDSSLGAAISIAARLESRVGERAAALRHLRKAISYSHHNGDRTTLFSALDRGVEVMWNIGDHETAVLLHGVLTDDANRSMDTIASTPEGLERMRVVAEARATLDPNRFDELVCLGAAMSYAEIIDRVLSAIDSAAESVERPRNPGVP